MQRHRVELYLLRLYLHVDIRDGMLTLLQVTREDLHRHLLELLLPAQHIQRTEGPRRDHADERGAVAHHGRATGVAAQHRIVVPHLGTDHEHAQLQVLRRFRHINVHDHLVRLPHHQQLLLLRQRDVGVRKGAGSARLQAGSVGI